MKYILIIGYQVFEKNKNNPRVSVSLDGHLLDTFDCDNEKTTQVSISEEYNLKENYPCYYRTMNFSRHWSYSSPAKCKFIELDSATWTDNNQLTIEVSDNDSNYNNGFMTKRSLICISPVFLISKDLYDNPTVVRDLMRRSHNLKVGGRLANAKIDRALPWPGLSQHPEKDISAASGRGGNFKMHFDIRKKHKTHILVKAGTIPKGWLLIDKYSSAWLQQHFKKYFDFVTDIVTTSTEENQVQFDKKVQLREKTKE